MEHVHLAVTASQLPQALEIPEELLLNMQWLFNQSVGEGQEATVLEQEETPRADEQTHQKIVDAFRAEVVSGWYAQAARLHQTTIAWIANAPRRIFPAVQEWNGLLIDHLCKASGHEDKSLVRDLQQGFPMVGEIKAYGVSARPKSKVDLTSNTVSKLLCHADSWSNRSRRNTVSRYRRSDRSTT